VKGLIPQVNEDFRVTCRKDRMPRDTSTGSWRNETVALIPGMDGSKEKIMAVRAG